MKIHLAKKDDLDTILAIYKSARSTMQANGNFTQWGNTYPSIDGLINDIEHDHLFVSVDDTDTIQGVFALILGDDPSYQTIDGAWLSDLAYATIHRIASSGARKGIFNACIDFAWSICPNLRIDTHANNRAMRHLIEKKGFVYCGIITVEDGSPRLAYQKVNS